MKNILFCLLAVASFSCNVNMNKTVKGNGHNKTETRDAPDITRIKIRGNMDVELVPGKPAVTVQADANLLKYIITREEDGWLVIRTRRNVNLRSKNPIKIYVSADMISAVDIAGSGNLVARGKFSGAEKLDIDIAGSGEVDIEVNTPTINVSIAGSGNVTLTGETRDATIGMAGSGSYDGAGLMTENTDIEIAGSGDATVYANISLNADVVGSGNVYYRGKARVKSNSIGSGKVKSLD